MEFISHAVKDISQLRDICKDGYIKATENLIQEGKFLTEFAYDYVGDAYVGYSSHVMCSLGLGYIHKGCPAAILFKTDVISRKSILYVKPYKYEFFLGIAKILRDEQIKGIIDWKQIIDAEKSYERKGFPPFKEYMQFFLNLPEEPCYKNASYDKVWGPSVYSESFIKIIIPKLKKSKIDSVKSKIETIRGNEIKTFIDKADNELLPCEILLDDEISLDKAYGFAVKKEHSDKVSFLSRYNKPIIFV